MLLQHWYKKKIELMKDNMETNLHPSKYVWMNYAKDKLFDPLGLKRLIK